MHHIEVLTPNQQLQHELNEGRDIWAGAKHTLKALHEQHEQLLRKFHHRQGFTLSSQAAHAELIKEHRALQLNLETSQRALQVKQDQAWDFKRECDELRHALDTQQHAVVSSKAQDEKLIKQLQQLQHAFEQEQHALASSKAQHEDLVKQHAQLQHAYAHKSQAVSSSKEQFTTLMHQHHQLQHAFENSKAARISAEVWCEDLMHDLEKLQVQLRELFDPAVLSVDSACCAVIHVLCTNHLACGVNI